MKGILAGVLSSAAIVGVTAVLPAAAADTEETTTDSTHCAEMRMEHRGDRGMRGDIERPDNWDEMTQEERHTYMRSQHMEMLEEKFGVTLPENWTEMSREEHREWLQSNTDIDLPEERVRQGSRGQKGNGQGEGQGLGQE